MFPLELKCKSSVVVRVDNIKAVCPVNWIRYDTL